MYIRNKNRRLQIYIKLLNNKNTLKVKQMLRDEFSGNPRWGKNVIDKVKLMIFVPVLAFKRRF